MSRIITAALTALAIWAPAVANAQSRDSAALAALSARIDSLMPQLERANALKLRDDSLRRARKLREQREPLDTLRLSPFVFVAPHSRAEWMLKLARSEFDLRQSVFSGLARAAPVTLMLEPKSGYLLFREWERQPRHHVITVSARRNSTSARIVGLGIDKALRDFLSDSTRAWLQDARLDYDNEYADVYRALAATDARLAAECLEKSGVACVDGLGLGAPLDSMKGRTIQQLERLVAGGAGYWNMGQQWLCLHRHLAQACIDVVNSRGHALPEPIPVSARASLFYFALRRGGAGSLARAGNAITPAAAISAAARAPLTQVVADWHAEVQHNAPMPGRDLAASAGSALLWAGVAIAFAFRSTRRRVG